MRLRRHMKKYLVVICILLVFGLLLHSFATKLKQFQTDGNIKPGRVFQAQLNRFGVESSKEKKEGTDDETDVHGFRKVRFDKLIPNEIPSTVHYVWCGNETFRFNHYLSVMSAWKILRPDIIEFHIQYPVKEDHQKYHSWFNEVQQLIPNFHVRQKPEYRPSEFSCSLSYGIDVLKDRGGIYIDSSFVFMNNFVNLSSSAFSIGISRSDTSVVFIKAKRKDPTLNKIIYTQKMKSLNREFPDAIKCKYLETNLTDADGIPCVLLGQNVFPVDIFKLNNDFGRVSRQLTFGSKLAVHDTPHLGGKIPKIVHYVWFGEHKMSFIMYLSLMSTFNIIKPEKVFIHGDNHLYGEYWDKVKNNPLLVQIYRERPVTVYGHKVIYTQHYSDILRADILLKYGGIYVDFDALWLRPVDDLIDAGHDVVLNFDHMRRGDYPETINMGVVMAKPQARFLQIWQGKFINYKTNDFFYNAIELPYKVYEMHPDLVHVERHLQVMCYQLLCHPTFKKRYMDWTKDQEFDWRTEAYAIHFTFPDPREFDSLEALRNGTNKFSEMGKHILRKSGIEI